MGYYPYGLAMAGISSQAQGSLTNKYKYNGGSELQSSEFSDGSGLDLYATNFRSLDPQLGRFWQVDPLAMTSVFLSPYQYGNNNPTLFNDPFGLDTVRANGDDKQNIKIRQGDVLAWTVGKTTSYYTYDPGNENAVNGFVGEGLSEEGGSVTVTTKKRTIPRLFSLAWSGHLELDQRNTTSGRTTFLPR